MTIVVSLGLTALFIIVPFLVGNIYSVMLRKKTIGISGLYFSGMAIVYAGLFALQMAIIKFKFDFQMVMKVYHIYFAILITLGMLAFLWKLFKEKNIKWDIIWSKNAMYIYGLIALQGILYIALKNPYFENNALLETTQITMKTETIYEYNAYSLLPAVAGFPLANKLMCLPVLYSYLCVVFGVKPAILFNFILPAVTLLGFYFIMTMWVQRLAKEHSMKWQRLLLTLLIVVWVGDSWNCATSFRILHEGYSGEAIFFGILSAYALYELKNKRYLIGAVCVATFPGLVKYSTVIDLLKGFSGYWQEAATYGGMLLLYVIAVMISIFCNKKVSLHLLNLNLTISLIGYGIWMKVIESETVKRRKAANAVVLICFFILCGNISIISGATKWRSNVYGVPKEEYEILETLAKENNGETIKVMAYDDVSRWICRLDLPIVPVVGYDKDGQNTGWYSYETYDENLCKLWECIQNPSDDMESVLMSLKEEIAMDYVVIKRITEKNPIQDNPSLKCVAETPSYLAYSVDKK